MKAQRLRNLTTGILHTTMEDIQEDLEHLTRLNGIFDIQMPSLYDKLLPWLRKK